MPSMKPVRFRPWSAGVTRLQPAPCVRGRGVRRSRRTVSLRVNAVTDYRGFYGTYQLTKPPKTSTPTNLTTTTTPFQGTVSTSVDAAHDSQYFTFNVPAGATEVGAHIDWAETNYDMDLYLYDSTGRLADKSTNGDVNHEDVSVTGSTDPMVPTAGLPAGEWQVEVRGWLVAAPEPFTGTFKVTYPAP
jgi:hypothetical protein